ncbi:MAG TPA: N-acetylglucosamine-6-phosphate deacetylase [Rhizorhapis sp.]|nr:N-acetylglucosamine-6-phosphate deacetylase [Rhizorhapis sp.]HKR17442.1 N-acetylglucosamine-6-phosphate deacetylase [Rhizorhapis sp.]
MMFALAHGRILIGASFVEGRAVLVEEGHIAAIVPEADIPAGTLVHDLGGQMLVPGFIDTQLNGGGGVLFNDNPAIDAIAAIGAAHRAFGTTGFLPTLISDDLEVIRRAVAAVDEAIHKGVPGVLGIHIEGPFLNPLRKGIHDGSKIRPLDDEGFSAITGLKRGRTLLTLAPERTTPMMVRRLADAGIIVAAGHSEASCAEVKLALDHGLTGFTHLFNAMSPLTAREPGVTGAALDDSRAWCGLIADGRHVDPVAMRVALRCKGPEKLMLVTDAMPSVGIASKHFMLQGQRIEVIDGACVNQDGTLAGSDLDMGHAVRNAAAMLEVGLETAIQMASATPAAFLGLSHRTGRIAAGLAADLAALDESGRVMQSWIAGRTA